LHGLGGKKTQRVKNKDTGGKNIIYFPPVGIRRYCHKKDCVQQEKYDLISLLPYFPPQVTVCESRTIIARPKGEKNKDTGKNIIYFPPGCFL
jgi:hypothetical protein